MAIRDTAGTRPDETAVMAARRTLRSGTRVAGAVLSLGLLAGAAVWSVKLVIRDVSGVPVVRAMTGPVRELPAEPGGTAMDNMGLSVNTIAAEGAAAPTPDALRLAPGPVELADEDTAVAALGPATAPPEQRINASVAAMVAELTRDALPLDPAVTVAVAVAPQPDRDSPAPAGLTGIALPPAGARPADGLADDAGRPDIAADGDVPAALRPRERPQRLASAATGQDAVTSDAVNAAITLALASVADGGSDAIDPETLAPGTRLAQLGAFETPAVAAREWDRLEVKFADYMAGKARVIQESQSGGRTFFRLRAHGFDDLDAARRFCAALQAERAECIPVVTR